MENGVVSPFLHSYVHKRNGKKTRYIYARLVDGVHSTHAPSAALTRHLETTIDINECNLYILLYINMLLFCGMLIFPLWIQ